MKRDRSGGLDSWLGVKRSNHPFLPALNHQSLTAPESHLIQRSSIFSEGRA
jgi:hypothetical protein